MPEFNLTSSKKLIPVFGFLLLFILITIAISILKSGNSQENKSTDRKSDISQVGLPYLTVDYSIVLSEETNQININIINPPYEQNRTKALEWLVSKGVNIGDFDIIYTPQNQFQQ